MRRMVGRLALLAIALLAAACSPATGRNPREMAILHTYPRTPRPILLPAPLYFLSGCGGSVQVWRLERDGVTVRLITQEAGGVSAFDVSPTGKLAYATQTGTLSVLSPGSRRPQRLLTLDRATRQAQITSVSWSPDERQIAYTLYTPLDRIPKGVYADAIWAKDGLWVRDLGRRAERQILPNIPHDRISERERIIREAFWSPRGDALLVRLQARDADYFGLIDLSTPYILSAADPQPSRTPLYGQVAWMPDGQSLIRGGAFASGPSNLALVDRTSSRVTVLLDGRNNGTSIAYPHPLPSGRIAFLLAGGDGCYRLHSARLTEFGQLVEVRAGEKCFPWPAVVAWEPRGRGVAMVVPASDADAKTELLYAPLDGSTAQRLAPAHTTIRRLVWGP